MSNTLLPPNATALERNLEQATARLADIPVPVRDVLAPDTAPAQALPWLAWALSVTEWQSSWTEAQKRAVIRESIFVHRHRGTLAAVRRALGAVDFSIDIEEWFQASPPAAPYTFRTEVQIAERGIDLAAQAEIERLIANAKNTRSHLSGITLVGVSEAQLFIGAAMVAGETADVEAFEGFDFTVSGTLAVQAATANSVSISVYPGAG